jgi:hypothetical protein
MKLKLAYTGLWWASDEKEYYLMLLNKPEAPFRILDIHVDLFSITMWKRYTKKIG